MHAVKRGGSGVWTSGAPSAVQINTASGKENTRAGAVRSAPSPTAERLLTDHGARSAHRAGAQTGGGALPKSPEPWGDVRVARTLSPHAVAAVLAAGW